MKKHLIYVLVAWSVLWQFSCSKIKEKDPILPVDTTTAAMPSLSLSVEEDSSVSLDLNPILPHNEPYTLQFGTLLHGKIMVEDGGKRLRYKSTSTGWKSDSTGYEFCRKGRCRTGVFKVINLNYVPVVVADTIIIPSIGPFYIGYLSSLEETLVPAGITGKLISLTHNYYTATIQESDSTKFLYFSGGGGTVGTFGFDDITYVVKASNGDLYKGGFEIVMGDTCGEARARNDPFDITGNTKTWLPAEWFANDQPCDFVEDNYNIRISLNAYTDNLTVQTPNGEVTDTMVAGVQQLQYKRTNLSASEDTFWYYVKAGFNQRITRAKVKLRFQ